MLVVFRSDDRKKSAITLIVNQNVPGAANFNGMGNSV